MHEGAAPAQLKIYFGTRVEGDDYMSMLAKAGKEANAVKPGDILSDGKTFFAIATADGAVSVTDSRWQARNVWKSKAFLAGFRNPETWSTTQGTSAEILKNTRA